MASTHDPGFLAIEGVIGVGKSTLSRGSPSGSMPGPSWKRWRRIRSSTGSTRIGGASPSSARCSSCCRAIRQQRALGQVDLFEGRIVCDYLFRKDRIFATLNLDESEMDLYDQIWPLLERDLPRPDRVVYLQASLETLMRRIERRGRDLRAGDRPRIPPLPRRGVQPVLLPLRGSPAPRRQHRRDRLRRERGGLRGSPDPDSRTHGRARSTTIPWGGRPDGQRDLTIRDIRGDEGRKERIVGSYLLRPSDRADPRPRGVDILLVGDSLGNVVLGYGSNTIPVTIEEMIHHARAVMRAAPRALVVVDMPFGSFQIGVEQADGGRRPRDQGDRRRRGEARGGRAQSRDDPRHGRCRASRSWDTSDSPRSRFSRSADSTSRGGAARGTA